jgi:hypothetical protein
VSFGDLWNRTLVYFGIAEEDEDYYEDDEVYEPSESLEQSYRERPNVRRLTPRRRSQGYDTDRIEEPRRRRLSAAAVWLGCGHGRGAESRIGARPSRCRGASATPSRSRQVQPRSR